MDKIDQSEVSVGAKEKNDSNGNDGRKRSIHKIQNVLSSRIRTRVGRIPNRCLLFICQINMIFRYDVNFDWSIDVTTIELLFQRTLPTCVQFLELLSGSRLECAGGGVLDEKFIKNDCYLISLFVTGNGGGTVLPVFTNNVVSTQPTQFFHKKLQNERLQARFKRNLNKTINNNILHSFGGH